MDMYGFKSLRMMSALQNEKGKKNCIEFGVLVLVSYLDASCPLFILAAGACAGGILWRTKQLKLLLNNMLNIKYNLFMNNDGEG